MNDKQQDPCRRCAPVVVRAVGAWILVVATIKLFKGTPGDLPKLVHDFLPAVDLGLKFKLSLAIELATGLLALLHPRLGWLLQVPMLTLFVGMLVHMTVTDVKSCGCFGGALAVHPAVMLAIDGACLLAILLCRPWSSLARAPLRLQVLAPVVLVSIASPWLVFSREPDLKPVRDESGVWHLPEERPRFAILNPRSQKWEGQPIRDTKLGIWIDTDQYPQDAIWILYRITCSHCAKELADIAANYDGQTMYVLVRIPEPNEEEAREVHVYPPVYVEAILPPVVPYVGQTPWTMKLEGGVVVDVRAGEGVDDSGRPDAPTESPAK